MLYSNGIKYATLLDGRALRFLDARQRACLAANILDEPGPFKPTITQLVTMLKLTVAYVAIAREMTAFQRAAIMDGSDTTSFSLIKKQKKAAGIDDRKLLAIVRTAGVDRVLNAACAIEAAE
jgi:hypothetical protein